MSEETSVSSVVDETVETTVPSAVDELEETTVAVSSEIPTPTTVESSNEVVTLQAISDFSYELVDGTYHITGLVNTELRSIVIPDTIDGIPVTLSQRCLKQVLPSLPQWNPHQLVRRRHLQLNDH